MQNDTFKRFSRDLHEALSIPGNFFNKQAKKISLAGDRKKIRNSHSHTYDSFTTAKVKQVAPETCSLQDVSISDASEIVSTHEDHEDRLHLTMSTYGGPDTQGHGRRSSSMKSPLSAGSNKVFLKEQKPLIIHCPPSIPSLEQLSPQRRAWVQSWPPSPLPFQNEAWDTVDDAQYTNQNNVASVYRNPNEATGLLFVKLMQVTNKATTKAFDVECSVRIGNEERTSYPTRSCKDNSGSTAAMNEIFLFNVNEPFQLEMTVFGSPVPTKFGTIAGISNTQRAILGQLDLSFCLESMEKSVWMYKLNRSAEELGKSNIKSDCEVMVMIGLHVFEEPIEDRSWETEMLYQGSLTFMTRGGRMASWRRYWAVLEGCALKLYDTEYQQKRDVLSVIPLTHIARIQPPDCDKVDVGANGISFIVDPEGVDMKTLHSSYSHVDPSELDYSLYAFTDSTHLHEKWNAHLEKALVQYQENLARRQSLKGLSRSPYESSMPPSPLNVEVNGEAEAAEVELIDLKYVW
ncbi:hypothetical protein EDD11_010534 [Mortierella claussenii]|nr:hypothetical protein EDD11_010534 [Mortierella claussenii]